MSNPPPDTVRKPLDLRAFLLMMFLCVVWGFQQVAMKAVSGDIAPVMQLSLRFSCAAVFFAVLVLRSEGMRWFEDGTLPSGVLLGVLFSLEFLLLGSALQHTSAAHAVVFLYSAPVFTAVGVQFLPEERMGPEQWWGMAIAFGGIAVAFFESGNRPWAEILKGDFLALLAGAAWGASNVVLRRGRISRASTVKTVCYQVAIAGVLLGLYASTTAQNQITWSLASISAVVFQTVIISIISYLIWFWLLRHYLTSRLMLFSLLTPLIGVFFGAAFLGDRLEAQFGAGALLVLAGILLVNRRVLFARAK
jgi:drug/metabolite transporter (DMT)-like permease